MDLSLSDLDMNPFLISIMHTQLNLKSPHDLAEWLLRQRLERSMVTGFGITLQNIAKEFSSETPLSNITMKIKKNGKIYNIKIKAGANHNIQVVQNIKQVLQQSKKLEPNSIPIFGVCYGNEDSVGSIVKKHIEEIQMVVGKDFWEFISNDPNCYEKILQIATDVDKNYRDLDVGSLGDVIEKKVKYLTIELEKIYGNDEDKFWRNVLEGKH